jgi:capsular polysaccharide transport system permease protein
MSQSGPLVEAPNTSVAVRGRKMAASLSSYARQLNFENKSRRHLYRIAGLAPRTQDRIFSFLIKASFVLCFVGPVVLASIYYGFIASAQYESEVRFVLRSATPLLSRDRFSDTAFEPKAKIVQDTQIVVNYLNSPSFIAELREAVDLDRVYRGENIDFLSKLKDDYSREELLDYWGNHHYAWVHPKSGIVNLDVTAYSAQDAQTLLNLTMDLTEGRVNKMNSDIWSTLQEASASELETASANLEQARVDFQKIQDAAGVFDVELTAQGFSDTLTDLEGQLAQLRVQRESLEGMLDEDSIALRTLDSSIKAVEAQVASVQSSSAGVSVSGSQSLADSSTKFEQAKLEIEIAENRFQAAVAGMERVRIISSLQLVYLDHFADPTLPEDSSGPNVPLTLLFVVIGALAFWGVIGGGLAMLRNRID